MREVLVVPVWWLLGYLAASSLGLVGLLWLAAYRKYYFHLVPFVVGYAVLTALGLGYLDLQGFLWWYLAPLSVVLFLGLSRHLRSEGVLAAYGRLEDQVLEAIPEGDIRQQVAKELAPSRAITQDVVVSVVFFVLAFLAAFYLSGRVV